MMKAHKKSGETFTIMNGIESKYHAITTKIAVMIEAKLETAHDGTGKENTHKSFRGSEHGKGATPARTRTRTTDVRIQNGGAERAQPTVC